MKNHESSVQTSLTWKFAAQSGLMVICLCCSSISASATNSLKNSLFVQNRTNGFSHSGFLCSLNGTPVLTKSKNSSVLFHVLANPKKSSSIEAVWSTGAIETKNQAKEEVAKIIETDSNGGQFLPLHDTQSYARYRRVGVELRPKYLLQIFGELKNSPPKKANAKIRTFIRKDNEEIRVVTRRLSCTQLSHEQEKTSEKDFERLAWSMIPLILEEIEFIQAQINLRIEQPSDNSPWLVKETAASLTSVPFPLPLGYQAVMNHNPIFQKEWLEATKSIEDLEVKHRKELSILTTDLRNKIIAIQKSLETIEGKKKEKAKDLNEDQNAQLCKYKERLIKVAQWATRTLVFTSNNSKLSEPILPLNQIAEAQLQCGI